MVPMQNLPSFKAHQGIGSWASNQDVFLKDHRVEEMQSFKRFFVYFSIKHRKLQCIKNNYLVPLIFLDR